MLPLFFSLAYAHAREKRPGDEARVVACPDAPRPLKLEVGLVHVTLEPFLGSAESACSENPTTNQIALLPKVT